MIQVENRDYVVCCLGEPLKYFVNNAQMNILHCNDTINLLDNISLLKQGYTLKNTLSLLMMGYSKINKLRQGQLNQSFNTSDKIMIDAFGSNIPAQYFKCKQNGKILMTEAVNIGSIPNMLNTFDTIKVNHPNFDFEKFPNAFFSHVLVLNMIKADTQLVDLIQNKDFTDKLIYEYRLIIEINEILNRNNTFELTDLLKTSVLHKHYTLLDYLIQNKYIKLLYNVLIGDNYSLTLSLLEVDPRDYNYEAYHLCLDIKNYTATELIIKNIIERNWYEKQVFINSINMIHGQESDLPYNILSYYTSNMC